MTSSCTASLIALTALLPGFAAAHSEGAPHVELAWSFEPWVVITLGASAALYTGGLARIWRKAGRGSGVSLAQAGCFYTGLAAVVAALVSPLDAMAAYLFSAHMVQHEMLMIVAAPLLVLGKPLAVWAWAVPRSMSRALAGASANRTLSALWSGVSNPPCAWALHACALWVWHIPALFDAALANESLHTVQHLSFFLSALLFWWTPLGDASRTRRTTALLYLFTTMLHTTILGALLAIAPSVWYPGYGAGPELFGITPLDDQQLGGLIMWVPGGIAYIAASLAIAWQSLKGKSDCWHPQASR